MKALAGFWRILTSTKVFVYGCYWLIILLIVGTVAQREIGLYAAQKTYFGSMFILAGGFVPLPGGRLTMLIVFLGLVTTFVRDFTLRPRKLGVTVLHFGAVMLLFGGFLTAYFAREGSVVIPEGDTVSFVSDYHARELAVIDTRDPEVDRVTAFDDALFHPGKTLTHSTFPGSIEIVKSIANCQPVRRQSSPPPDARGVYREVELMSAPLEAENERNTRALLLRVSGAGERADGLWAVFEHQTSPQTIPTSEGDRTLILRRERTYLPFAIELLDFEKQLHPGTGMARSYRSVVNLVQDDTKRRVVIQMNEPLRTHGYTFYQSSFMEGPGSETTVLAAVKNVGRTLPYISSLVMCLGLLIHLVIKVPSLIRARRGAA
jgi:hypothetical protein